MISKIEVERFTLSSSKPFDQVVAALNSAVGHLDMSEFWKSTHRGEVPVAELQNTIEKGLGRTGSKIFVSQNWLVRAICTHEVAPASKFGVHFRRGVQFVCSSTLPDNSFPS